MVLKSILECLVIQLFFIKLDFEVAATTGERSAIFLIDMQIRCMVYLYFT